MNNRKTEIVVGVFTAGIIVLLIAIFQYIGGVTTIAAKGYPVKVNFEYVPGIVPKSPVEFAGVPVGFVEKVELTPEGKAALTLRIRPEVKMGEDVKAAVATRGVLGETYILLTPGGDPAARRLEPGGVIQNALPSGDMNALMTKLNDIAIDIKELTGTMRDVFATEDGEKSMQEVLANLRDISRNLRDVTADEKLGEVMDGIKAVTDNLNRLLDRREGDASQAVAKLRETTERLASITGRIDEGKGAVGKLISDDEIADNLSEAITGISDFVGRINRLKTEVDYHNEYVAAAGDARNYFSLRLRPRQDKYFLFEIVSDPVGGRETVITDTTVSAGGATSQIHTEELRRNRDKLLFSAQFAKQFYEFTFRGGLIESRGGVGLDYQFRNLMLAFNAFDFDRPGQDNPRLKLYGTYTLFKKLYLLAGVDDLATEVGKPDFFMGFGLRFNDDDLKTLLTTVPTPGI